MSPIAKCICKKFACFASLINSLAFLPHRFLPLVWILSPESDKSWGGASPLVSGGSSVTYFAAWPRQRGHVRSLTSFHLNNSSNAVNFCSQTGTLSACVLVFLGEKREQRCKELGNWSKIMSGDRHAGERGALKLARVWRKEVVPPSRLSLECPYMSKGLAEVPVLNPKMCSNLKGTSISL